MSDDVVQLDLTLSVTEVPQANSLPLFVRLMEEVLRGNDEIATLAESLGVEERTAHYYADFGRWLHMLKTPEPARVAFTETGSSFAESVAARGRLFAQAMFQRKLVKTVQALKRDSTNADDLETLDTREACRRAIRGMTDLSASTATRRASGLAHMLAAAYKPSRIDWSTGEERPEFRRTLEYEGRSFATALGARQFGGTREYRIGFPKQVHAFVAQQGHGLSAKTWRRASYPSADNKAVWFGAVPVNPSTVELVGRGGRDLRRFLVHVAPYVALAVAVLTFRDAVGRPSVRLTHDMYGMHFWDHDHELGAPLEVVERLAGKLGLVSVTGLPAELAGAPSELVEPGTDADLVETLLEAGFMREKDTTFVLAPGVDAELRDAGEGTASLADLLGPAWDALRDLLRGSVR